VPGELSYPLLEATPVQDYVSTSPAAGADGCEIRMEKGAITR
jgi:hypothetical protein